MNFVPFHLKKTTQSMTRIVQISSCHILHYHQTSMATPKDTNDHFPRKTRNSPERNLFIPIAARPADLAKLSPLSHEILQTRLFFSHSTAKSVNLTKLHEFRVFPGFKAPFPCPLRQKIFSKSNFSQPHHLHTTDPLNIYKPEIRAIRQLKNWYPVSERRNKYCLPEIRTTIYIYCVKHRYAKY